MNFNSIKPSHCNAILVYECCGLPWFRGVSQYSWSSPTQLGASENILNAKKNVTESILLHQKFQTARKILKFSMQKL